MALASLLLWELLMLFAAPGSAELQILASSLLFLTASVIAAFYFGALAGISAAIFSLFLIRWRCFCFIEAIEINPFWLSFIFALCIILLGAVSFYTHYMFKARERFLSDLLISLSHDIKTPLASILGAVSTLKHFGRKLDRESMDELLQNAHVDALKLERYVSNIVDMAKIHHHQLEADPRETSVKSLLEESLSRYTEPTQKRFKVNNSNPAQSLLVDKALMQKAIRHLVDNAVCFSPEKSDIILNTEIIGSDWHLHILNQGPGFPATWNNRCDKMRRSSKRDSDCNGTGFGLVICEAILKLHDGSLKLDSSDIAAEGNKATIILPLKTA